MILLNFCNINFGNDIGKWLYSPEVMLCKVFSPGLFFHLSTACVILVHHFGNCAILRGKRGVGLIGWYISPSQSMQDKFVHSSASLWVGWFRNQKPPIGCNAAVMVDLEQMAIIILAYPSCTFFSQSSHYSCSYSLLWKGQAILRS